MKKKAFFFTLLVFIFFFIVLISVTAWNQTKESQQQQDVSSSRVTRIGEFSNMLRDDAFRTTQLVGFNALRTATAYVASNNNSLYLNDSSCLNKSCIYELMYNATIAGKQNYTTWGNHIVNFSAPDQMGGLTLSIWDKNMSRLANISNFDIKMSRQDIAIYQSDPWNVKIGYNLYVNITDRALDAVFRTDFLPIAVTIPLTNYTYAGG
jgi:hypothetical protein